MGLVSFLTFVVLNGINLLTEHADRGTDEVTDCGAISMIQVESGSF
jgi:hypothetical protein